MDFQYSAAALASFIPIVLWSVILSIIFGFISRMVVKSKGYTSKENHGFAWGFWLTWIGLIVCACKANKNAANSNSDELLKYHQLLENGAITQEEYEKQKQRLLK